MKRKLDEIVFHDVPVEKVIFNPKNQQLVIDILLDDALNDCYISQRLVFPIIKMIQLDEVVLITNDDLEIYSFDYELKGNHLYGKFVFLLDFGKSMAMIEFVSEIVT